MIKDRYPPHCDLSSDGLCHQLNILARLIHPRHLPCPDCPLVRDFADFINYGKSQPRISINPDETTVYVDTGPYHFYVKDGTVKEIDRSTPINSILKKFKQRR